MKVNYLEDGSYSLAMVCIKMKLKLNNGLPPNQYSSVSSQLVQLVAGEHHNVRQDIKIESCIEGIDWTVKVSFE